MAIQQQQGASRQHAASGGMAAAAATAALAPPPPPAPALEIRRYCPLTDHAAVVEICRHVYGGSDDLPQRINAEAARPCTHVLALAAPGEPLDALLCCQQRGDVLWVYGARTRESLRGRGLGERLLEEAEQLAHSLGAAAMLSVTITLNGTMQRLFARRGFVQQCQVVSWPPSPVAHAVHGQLQQLAQQQGQPASLLSALPAVRSVADSAAARALLPHWRRCTSAEDLAAVLRLLRQRRTDAAAAAAAAAAPAFSWLPGEYECLPVQSAQVRDLLAAGQVWLLEAAAPPACGDSGGSGGSPPPHELPAAVLACHGPGHGGVRHGGVVAGSRAALESAVLHAAAVDPGLCKWYIDCAGRCSHPELWGAAPGDQHHILPYHKPLRTAGC